MNDNSLTKFPPEIGRLQNLQVLDASNNKLRSLPPEIGDLRRLKELHLNNNYLRTLPYELGKLFKLQILGIKGNPLPADLVNLQAEVNGTSKLLTYLLDSLPSMSIFISGFTDRRIELLLRYYMTSNKIKLNLAGHISKIIKFCTLVRR